MLGTPEKRRLGSPNFEEVLEDMALCNEHALDVAAAEARAEDGPLNYAGYCVCVWRRMPCCRPISHNFLANTVHPLKINGTFLSRRTSRASLLNQLWINLRI